jgi:uncharacterized protein
MKDLIAIDLRGNRAQEQWGSLAQLPGQERSGIPTRSLSHPPNLPPAPAHAQRTVRLSAERNGSPGAESKGVEARNGVIFLALALMASLCWNSSSIASEVPALNATINDFAGMMPQASVEDLGARLARFRTETSNPVIVVTINSLDGESIDSFGRRTFKNLPFASADLEKAVLLVVARKERQVGVQAGPALRELFPEPEASRKLYDHVALYFDGLRPDLGIYGAVQYLFRVIKGDVRVGSQSEEEKLEETSLSGRGAGAIFAAFLAPVLALFVGGLWGIYATQYGVQRGIRLLMGAIFGGGTAKIVAGLMSALGGFSDNLWYFIMALSIPLGVFGSLTEFWMSGDWRGIPRVKGRKRKPEDHMGI